MDASANAVEEDSPDSPLSPLLHGTGASKACAIPVSALQAVLSSVTQQQEGLLSLSDHLTRELSDVQASVRRVQAMLHELGVPSVVAQSPTTLAQFPNMKMRPSEASQRSAISFASSDPAPSRQRTGETAIPADATRVRVSKGGGSTASVERDLSNPLDYADDVERIAKYRVQARLGLYNTKGLVTARILGEAVGALGVDAYGLADMERMIRHMLKRRTTDQPEEANQGTSDAGCASGGKLRRTGTPRAAFDALRRQRAKRRSSNNSDVWMPEDDEEGIKMGAFVDALLTVDTWCDRDDIRKQVAIVKEVLFSGNANKLVAELTQVRVDQLAAPQPPLDPMVLLEPAVGAIIFLNAVSIGMQADPMMLPGFSWLYVDLFFTVFFILEMLFRIWFTGLRQHFRGPDWIWNIFDAVVVALSALGSAVEIFYPAAPAALGTSSFSIMRMIRLTRLTRLFRIFRLRYMKELTLMVKGLLGGLKTLGSAVVLLFFTIYVIAVVLTILFATDPAVPSAVMRDELFATVPRSMFTVFRCVLGDCTTSDGEPVALQMSNAFGIPFMWGYFAIMVFVVFGLFNLVIAVYIESTIDASKRTKARDKVQRQRESLRIAHTTKRLLKKFCSARRKVAALSRSENSEDVRALLKQSELEDVDGMMVEVSRELFLNVIQDPQVQSLMDDLEIPADRAELFDLLDADGSGGLQVSELIQGLLRVRGDAKKSDVVAALLATRSLQDSFAGFQGATLQHLEAILSRLGDASGGRQPPGDTRPGRRASRHGSADKGADVELLLLPPAERPNALGVRHVLLAPPGGRPNTPGCRGRPENQPETVRV